MSFLGGIDRIILRAGKKYMDRWLDLLAGVGPEMDYGDLVR